MGRLERFHYSLSGRTFRAITLFCLIISAAAILFGFALYSATVNREYRVSTWHLSQMAESAIDKRIVRREAKEVLAVYDAMTPEEQAENKAVGFDFEQRAEFESIRHELDAIKADGGAIAAYVAAMDTVNNRMVFIVDGDYRDSFCPPGTWEAVAKKDMDSLVNGDRSGLLDHYYDVAPMPSVIVNWEDYGYRCTAGAELFSVGDYSVMVFVDKDMNAAAAASRTFLLQYVLLLLAVTVIVALLAIRHIQRTTVRPINELAKAAEQYTKAGNNGQNDGSIFSRLDIRTGDEIENLCLTMKDMERDLGNYVRTITRVTGEKERLGAELNIASQIQEGMLPSIFPAFPDRKEFDVYASMHTAKEVGGDFYDFFLIDDDHLAVVMADVSGKGVPAALFMMASKILINNFSAIGRTSPAYILETVNHQICLNNPAEMFVTAWLGILELSTGTLRAANAGHEYPVIQHKGSRYQLFKDQHGFVLGGMDGVRYQEYEIPLRPGDAIFLYTDGVTEATDRNNTLFGTERMIAALNRAGDDNPETVLNIVKQEIDAFVGDAPQFDDITMLCLRYLGDSMKKITIEAKTENLPEVLAFIDGELEAAGCAMKTQMQIDIAVEEIFVNIANYAYAPGSGSAVIGIDVRDGRAEITFADSGIPYDPLSKSDPDVTLSADDREIGGLGVFMVKKTMDELKYQYLDGQNRLTMFKTL